MTEPRHINEDYEGELCPDCGRRYPFPVDKHHDAWECSFWRRQKNKKQKGTQK